MRFLVLLFFLRIPIVAVPQEIKVELDSVLITSKSGFDVEEFISLVKQDTSFYKAFKNLSYYPNRSVGELNVFSKKELERASLYREARQYLQNKNKWLVITDEKVKGNIYKKEKFNYYTAELFDFVFYRKDTVKVSNIISKKDQSIKAYSQQEKHKENLKILLFNPGAEVQGVPLIGNKLAIFDPDMLKYYEYKISTISYKDTTPCYVFSCKAKSDLNFLQRDNIVIKEFISYFDRRTFNILYRYYHLAYSSVLFDFDVKMYVQLNILEKVILPESIIYAGYWDIPFKNQEKVSFKINFYDFKIVD